MHSHVRKTKQIRAVSPVAIQKKDPVVSMPGLGNNLQAAVGNSSQVKQLKQYQAMADNGRSLQKTLPAVLVLQKMNGDGKEEKKKVVTEPEEEPLVESDAVIKPVKGGTVLEFTLYDGIYFSTENNTEFDKVIEILWNQGRMKDLRTVYMGIILKCNKTMEGLIFQGFADKVMAWIKRNPGEFKKGKTLDEFITHVAKGFSWMPEGLVDLMATSGLWAGQSVNDIALRLRILAAAREAGKKLSQKQLELQEGNAGDYEDDKDFGLIDARSATFAAAVKAYADQQKGKKVKPQQQITCLYNLACNILLPELTQVGLFPPLNFVGFGEDCLFKRSEWIMCIGYEPIPLEVVDELSASILHETRHVEQAWIICSKRWFKKELLTGIKPAICDSIKKNCKYPEDTGKQVLEQSIRGAKFKVDHDSLDQVRSELGLSLTIDTPVTEVNWAKFEEFFGRIFWYYNHPREADAYASEAKYKTSYKALEGKKQLNL
jgi:hypothetical protein